ncbi:MAG TPA: class I SAM-dependent methyltransferase [Vicinamibacterales bacterium]|nr:class I SAM-dependent methyltransferase [Vicinamibacterales bacterium]
MDWPIPTRKAVDIAVPSGAHPSSASYPDVDAWEAVAADWHPGHGAELWRAHSDAVYAMLLERWLPRAGLGCVLKTDLFDEAVSVGLYPVLASRARSVIGIDLAQWTARQARGRYPGMAMAGADVRRLPFPDAAFDAIVSLSTLDHFRARADLEAALGELQRVLRPGGTLVLTLDNLANPVVRLRNVLPFGLLNRIGLVPYFVGATCTPGGTARLLRTAGFRVDELTAVMHVPRVAAVALAALVQRRAGPDTHARFLDHLRRWERLAGWSTRWMTGHYVAVRATRLPAP